MSKIHVLNADKNGNYRLVIHEDVPAGNNAAGETWQSAFLEFLKVQHIKADGTMVVIQVDSVLTEGTGVGQITAAERVQVQSGAKIEIKGTVRASNDVNSTVVAELANILIAEKLTELQTVLKWYGHTQN